VKTFIDEVTGMIVVIADDFTGAAELAAIGLRYGLKAEVQTKLNLQTDSELLVIDTDTRSCSASEARSKVQQVITQLLKIQPDWIYKKVDSVLRGQPAAELEAIIELLPQDRVILIPANPSFGRIIRRGQYFINTKPLHETSFAADPEYPASSSDILELLAKPRSLQKLAMHHPQPIPPNTLAIGDAATPDDLLAWAELIDQQTFGAGAAEFFNSILLSRGFAQKSVEQAFQHDKDKNTLFVCTSSSAYSKSAIQQAKIFNIPVCEMPAELFETDTPPEQFLNNWTEETVEAIGSNPSVIIAINRPVSPSRVLARKLCGLTATMINNLFDQVSIEQLYIEGGATASALFKLLKWQQFYPICELAPGVITMKVQQRPDICLTIKPGSYPWPDNIWASK
jgi:uncharacterized protein YgbK (DUF1537 family)